MGFWSLNPYVGCAFGCAYCYARYTHRWVLDRHANANPEHEELRAAHRTMAPWLAFERRIFVKQNAADVLRTHAAPRIREASRASRRRHDRHRHGDRSVSAGRASVSRHAIAARGVGGTSRAFHLHHHQESAHHARHRPVDAHRAHLEAVGAPVADLARPRSRAPTRAARSDARRAPARARPPSRGGHRDGHQRHAGAARRSPTRRRRSSDSCKPSPSAARRMSTRARCGCVRRRGCDICRSSRRSFRISPAAIARRTRTITK